MREMDKTTGSYSRLVVLVNEHKHFFRFSVFSVIIVVEEFAAPAIAYRDQFK